MSNNHSPSFDEIRGILKEVSASQKELSASQKETDQQIKELSASQKELSASQKETERFMRESRERTDRLMRESREKTDRFFRESRERTDRLMRESREKTDLFFRESREETDRQIRKTRGIFDSQWGQLVESLVRGKLLELLRSRGIEVTRYCQRMSVRYKTENGVLKEKEFDIIAINGQEVVVTEVKTTLTPEKVAYFIDGMKVFKKYFPEYSDHTVYGAVAYLKSDSEAHIFSERQGLFVVKATGDSASLINKQDFRPKAF